jgi:hypothetical protein
LASPVGIFNVQDFGMEHVAQRRAGLEARLVYLTTPNDNLDTTLIPSPIWVPFMH